MAANVSEPGADQGPRAGSPRGVEVATGSSTDFDNALRRGYDFWVEQFFLADGWPKYFPDHLYPVDIHSAASAIIALIELRRHIPNTLLLAKEIANWTLDNLRDEQGFFYYQKRRSFTVKIPYMRWSQAWMMYALARLREALEK
jgi:hypothetical protein